MRDDGLRRLLEGLSRETAPDIGVDSLFRRLRRRRLRIAATGLVVLGGLLGALLALRWRPPPPVYLDLHVIEANRAFDEPDQGPAELNLP